MNPTEEICPPFIMHFRFLSRLGRHLPNRRSGMALVLVLSFLVLLSALILAFFGSVTTETKASRHADAGNRSRELVDTVTSVVMAQVRAATTRGQTSPGHPSRA